MSLKFRYAGGLLLVVVLLCLFSAAAVSLLLRERYFLAGSLLLLLYLLTFAIGKKFKKIFFVLSVIKYLKSKGGVVTHSACQAFLIGAMKGTKTECQELAEEILATLVREGIVQRQGESLVLLG